ITCCGVMGYTQSLCSNSHTFSIGNQDQQLDFTGRQSGVLYRYLRSKKSHDTTGNRWRKWWASGKNTSQGGDKLFIGFIFEQIPVRTGTQGFKNMFVVIKDRNNNDMAGRINMTFG